MASERKIRRYSAFFQGWATAFGNHDKRLDEERNLLWLYGANQIGLVLTPDIKEIVDPLLLPAEEADPPEVELGLGVLQIAGVTVRFGEEDQREIDAVMGLLQGAGDLHLLQTYHLVYPTGTRILTLSRNTPLPLIYREIEPLTLRLV